MKTKKKNKLLIACVLSAFLLLGGIFLGISPTSKTAYADNPLSDFKFTQIGSGYSIAVQNKNITHADIPPTYLGLPIVEIAANGFASCPNLETITFPASVKKIGTGAFMNCAKLKDVPMVAPEIIGQNAFALCKKIETLVLPKTVQTVGANALLNVGIDNATNTTIYSRPLENVANTWTGWLNSFSGTVLYGDDLNCTFDPDRGGYIVDGFQFIQNNTQDLYLDTHKGLPILEIDENAFYWSALKSVHVGFDSTHRINIKSYVFNEAAIPTIKFDDNVTFDDENSTDEAFDKKSNSVFLSSTVEQIVLPDTLHSILPMMFQDCKELQSISFKSTPTQINTLPSHVTAVYDLAFSGCSLPSISVPKSVKKMGVAVFDEWSLERKLPTGIDISFTEDKVDYLIERWEATNGQEGWDPYWNSGCNRYIIEFWSTPGLSYTVLSDNSYSVSIGTATAESCVIMPTIHNRRDVFEIPANGFSNRSNVLKFTLPRTVKSIRDYAFQNCTGLTTFKIPTSVTYFGQGMLNGCNNLTSMTFPGNRAALGDATFKRMFNNSVPPSLKTVTIAGGSIISMELYDCSYIETIILPDTIKRIENRAFEGCTNLKNIILPEGLEYIGGGSFLECRSLTSITIPQSVTFIYSEAFVDCDNLTTVILKRPASMGIPEIYWSAFGNGTIGCPKLTLIAVPDSASETAYRDSCYTPQTGGMPGLRPLIKYIPGFIV